MMPVRIQRSRKHKMVNPNGLPIVYVGRPSEWGNPFTGPKAVDKFEARMIRNKNFRPDLFKQLIIIPLRGKNLSCWCKLTERCHADVLLKLANEGLEKEQEECMCDIHLRNTPDKPCLGHNKKCPCTILLSKNEEKIKEKV